MAKTFNDPLFSSQWYLVNTGQRGGSSRLDINVLPAWEKYSGKGVVVAVNDDGMDLTQPSLVANLLVQLAYDAVRGTTGQGFVVGPDGNSHGTVVGGIVGMAGNDGIGGVGVAYEAKIVPALAFGGPGPANSANLFLSNLAAGAWVSVNSWGADPAFAENFGASGTASDQAWGAALLRCATEARGGLGMVIEVSGGNERITKADMTLSNFNNNKLVISVGAIDENGRVTDYSTPGAALLVTAPGGTNITEVNQSVNTGFGIASADMRGQAGYNTSPGEQGDYSYQNVGTSYSGPMVGGVAALMLQANPNLGFRDVSSIMAMTARKVDAANPSWIQTSSKEWNLGGMHFSRDFGFGLIDAAAAVRLAEVWTPSPGTVANWQSAEGVSATPGSEIPDNNPSGYTVTATVTKNVLIERMEFDLNLTAAKPNELSATITSPGGTSVTLFDQPAKAPVDAWPGTFTIGATAFLGETSAGNWTLRLTDKVSGEVATYNSLVVRAWGSNVTNNSQYVFTDEFSTAGAVLTDNAGVDTLNAAAVSKAVNLNLGVGSQSSAGTGTFTISATSIIENAIGGLGNDILTGNSSSNRLTGGAGNDTLDGGEGVDTAVFLGARAVFTVTIAGSITTVQAISGTDGTDTLTNMERLKFSDTSLAFDINGNAGQGYRIYKAALDRVPDFKGLGDWIYALDAGINSLKQVAQGFINSAEFQTKYGVKATLNKLRF